MITEGKADHDSPRPPTHLFCRFDNGRVLNYDKAK